MTVGWITLDVGEQALVYNLQGRARVEEGPQRMFLWREKYIPLRAYSANQNEYLVVTLKNGKILHVQGPHSMFLNPLVHDTISVEAAVSLDANEVLVVYRRDPEQGKVSRYLKHGPTLFVPEANEWLHSFRWHGTDPNNKTRMIPGSLKFSKLQVIPDQFYYNVDEVRTADDALIRVKLMIFYELRNIEHMLDATQDPIADFINCVCADVIAFASKLTYMGFIEKSGKLNDMSNYPQLTERCKTIGYNVSKVVFRGYFASPKLQSMHDSAIEARTKLKIAYETEEQKQLLTDLNLKNERDRATVEQNMKLEELKHKQKIERSEQEHVLGLKRKDQDEKVRQMLIDHEAKMAARAQNDDFKIKYYQQLNDLQVDLTQFVLSESPHPQKVVKVVANKETANLHLHHS